MLPAYSGPYDRFDSPNIPMFTPDRAPEIPLGCFIDPPGAEPVDPLPGTVAVRDLYLPKASVRSIRGSLDRNALLINKENVAAGLAGFCVFLDGYFESYAPEYPDAIVGRKDEHNFKYDPQNEMLHFIPGGTPFHLLHFSIPAETVAGLLPDDERWAVELREKFARGERVVGKQAARLLRVQKEAVANVLDCPIGGKLGHALMETSIMQFQLLQLHMLFNSEEKPGAPRLTRRDRELAEAVKDYVTAHFLEDHTVVSLARHFGTNSNKLMRVFKSSFGTSIFEYIQELKMQHAEHLLKEQEMLVSEVAEVLGYKNPHHFSAAFKKKFNVCPSVLRVA